MHNDIQPSSHALSPYAKHLQTIHLFSSHPFGEQNYDSQTIIDVSTLHPTYIAIYIQASDSIIVLLPCRLSLCTDTRDRESRESKIRLIFLRSLTKRARYNFIALATCIRICNQFLLQFCLQRCLLVFNIACLEFRLKRKHDINKLESRSIYV